MANKRLHHRSLHRVGKRASQAADACLDQLFAGSLIEALHLVTLAPVKDQWRLNGAVIVWNGFKENEAKARKMLRGSAYVNGILDADARLKHLYRAALEILRVKNSRKPELKLIPITIPNSEIKSKHIEVMREVTFPAHAPTAAATSSLLAV
jgi:hypothetical protein